MRLSPRSTAISGALFRVVRFCLSDLSISPSQHMASLSVR
jgi:hypothetical protein